MKITAESIYVNGNVLTLDAAGSRAQAVAVSNGRVLAIGDTDMVLGLSHAGTHIIDLAGRTLMPGFYDAHSHMLHYALFADAVDMSPFSGVELRTVDICIEFLRRKLSKAGSGWLLAWNCYDPIDGEFDRDTLDRVSLDTPIAVFHESLHKCMLNSHALELCGIGEGTADPPGGLILRRLGTATPTGVLCEGMAHALMSYGPVADALEIDCGSVGRASELYASKGITTANEGADHFTPYRVLEAEARGTLKTRLILNPYRLSGNVDFAAFLESVKEKARLMRAQSELIRTAAVKLFYDGSIQVGTAYLSEPYLSGGRGVPVMEKAELRERIRLIHDAGLRTEIHCIGDAAITDALDCLELDLHQRGGVELRPTLIHALMIREADIARAKRLGVFLALYPAHIHYYGDEHVSLYLGKKRAERISPLGTALRLGAPFSIHDDAPSFPIDPLLNVSCAVGRETASGRVLGEDERISAIEALRAATINAAYQNGEEAVTGSIEPGKRADFVILDGDPTGIVPREIPNIRIERTVLGGTTTYNRDGDGIE